MNYLKLLSIAVALLLLGAGSADAQRCAFQASANTVRAEGLTEEVGMIDIRCQPPTQGDGVFSGQALNGAGDDDTLTISLTFNTNVTNMIEDDRDLDAMSGVAVDADQLPITADDDAEAGDANSSNDIAAAAIPMAKLSDDGETLTWTLDIDGSGDSIAAAGTAGPFGIGALDTTTEVDNGFRFVISGVRVNANRVGNGEDVTVSVMVGGSAVDAVGSSKIADVTTGLGIKVDAASGTQCAEPTEMTSITLEEGFAAAVKSSDEIVVTFTDVPEGVDVMVPDTIALGGTDENTFSLELKGTARTDGVGEIEDNMGAVDLNLSRAGQVIYTVAMETVDLNDPTTPDDSSDDTTRSTVSDTVNEEKVTINVSFDWDKNAPSLGEAWVFVSYYPTSTHGSDTFASEQTKVPRYMEGGSNKLLGITDCMSDLFYPFVTSASGYDTGIVVTNTSSSAGDCSASYSGGDAIELGEVMPNMQRIFLVSEHMEDFAGFLQVNCDFTPSSGFAHVVDSSGLAGSQGYIATGVPE